jgi:ABC-type sulfate/molybdate transport systems ATPase subunit
MGIEVRNITKTFGAFTVDVVRNGHPALQAVVARIHSAGPNVRLELTAESGERLCAELSQERYRSLGIGSGSTVYVTPLDVKVFAGS